MPPVAKKEEQQERPAAEDPRGIQFGTAVVYDDVYTGGGGGGGNEEYVAELPTAAEEEEEAANSAYARRDEDELDEGRISSHPSTRMAQRSVRSVQFNYPFIRPSWRVSKNRVVLQCLSNACWLLLFDQYFSQINLFISIVLPHVSFVSGRRSE